MRAEASEFETHEDPGKYSCKSYRMFLPDPAEDTHQGMLHIRKAAVGIQRQPVVLDLAPRHFNQVELRAIRWQEMQEHSLQCPEVQVAQEGLGSRCTDALSRVTMAGCHPLGNALHVAPQRRPPPQSLAGC